MDGSMKYGFSAIEGLAGDIDGRVTAIGGLLDDLQGRINTLANAWEGEAQTNFLAQKQKWETSANDMKGILARIATAVHTTAGDARATEARNASRFA